MKSGPSPLFSLEQEAHLVNYFKQMSDIGYSYTRVEATALASDYAVSIRLKDETDKQLSLQWFRSFMDRWPDFKLQKPPAYSYKSFTTTSWVVLVLSHSCHKFMRENHCKITRYNVGELCTNAYVKGLSPDNLRSSFRRSGIYSLDKSPYPQQMNLPATVYTQTETDGQNQETNDIIDHPNDIN
ncbi:unnamed protein product [Mytilus edulis]|uniref:HTH CENPB-type domain-containing protein n=1 Tax=Mytilus edulis TaxID=6550 RepID=A0A8S3T0L5_MYTED|nr:unnamed protein product [Mytilus edulis]